MPPRPFRDISPTSRVLTDTFLERNEFNFHSGNNGLSHTNPYHITSTPVFRPSRCIGTVPTSTESTDCIINIDIEKTPVTRPDTHIESTMAKINCQTFAGYPHENPTKFMSEFKSYSTFLRLSDDEERQIAAFHLHLKGPALTWFETLPNKQSWLHIKLAFTDRYEKFDCSNPSLLVETENFNSLTLLPGQPLEDFHMIITEKGLLLKKPDHELLARFIAGLPEKLAFYVRLSQPAHLMSALMQAKLGESCGYRKHGTTQPVVAAVSQENNMIKLQEQVANLTAKVDELSTKVAQPYASPPAPNPRPSDKKTTYPCYRCGGNGHIQRNCNWSGASHATPSVRCQLCKQNGHSVTECVQFLPVAAPNPSLAQGN